jgi:hypothetical protein
MAVQIGDLVGTWSMEHDGWRGTLTIKPSDQRTQAIEGSCTYTSWRIDGTYIEQGGASRAIKGVFQGKDLNRRASEPCKQSEHKVSFTIAFPNNTQQFEGYIFTRDTAAMAGYTWWAGIPFGWSARKH